MKGIIFTEFLDLVEDKFGLEMVDRIIEESDPESGGIYTAVGTYPFSEMLGLISRLSSNTAIPVDDLLYVYATHFFSVLTSSYSQLIESYKDPIELLASIENHIHMEVRKIYPDAELPSFETIERSDKRLVMIYRSSRAMYSFGRGLMDKTFDHYNKKAEILLEKIKQDGTEVKFVITQLDG